MKGRKSSIKACDVIEWRRFALVFHFLVIAQRFFNGTKWLKKRID